MKQYTVSLEKCTVLSCMSIISHRPQMFCFFLNAPPLDKISKWNPSWVMYMYTLAHVQTTHNHWPFSVWIAFLNVTKMSSRRNISRMYVAENLNSPKETSEYPREGLKWEKLALKRNKTFNVFNTNKTG